MHTALDVCRGVGFRVHTALNVCRGSGVSVHTALAVCRGNNTSLGGRRDICGGQNPRVRREPAPNPANPTRRSNRKSVLKTPLLCAPTDMASKEETDETRTEDEYVPGKPLNPCLFYTLCLCRFRVQITSSSYISPFSHLKPGDFPNPFAPGVL